MIIFLVPDYMEIMVNQAFAKMTAQNPNVTLPARDQMERMMKIFMFVGAIFSPIMQALIGAGVAALVGYFAKPQKKTPPQLPQEIRAKASPENPNPSTTE
jgi:hypothetical protein